MTAAKAPMQATTRLSNYHSSKSCESAPTPDIAASGLVASEFGDGVVASTKIIGSLALVLPLSLGKTGINGSLRRCGGHKGHGDGQEGYCVEVDLHLDGERERF